MAGAVVGVHYRVGKKLGEGSFGTIFDGVDVLTNRPIAIKFEPRKTDAPQLKDEYRSYKILDGTPGIPRVYYFGHEGLHSILVMDLLGPSLEDLFDWCGRKFSPKTTCMVGKQMITLVESIHNHSLVYRDIKPDNFLIGKPKTPSANDVFVVDFGMAKRYRDPTNLQHIPYREHKSLSGTARYMSINTHLGREQSRRDDLEALGHVLLYFCRGSLPWQGLKAATNKHKYEKIGEKKMSTHPDVLCQDVPAQFGEFMRYVRALTFEEAPDYDYLRSLLADIMREHSWQEDGHFDWMDLNNGRGWDHTNKKPNLHGYGHPTPVRGPPCGGGQIAAAAGQQHLEYYTGAANAMLGRHNVAAQRQVPRSGTTSLVPILPSAFGTRNNSAICSHIDSKLGYGTGPSTPGYRASSRKSGSQASPSMESQGWFCCCR